MATHSHWPFLVVASVGMPLDSSSLDTSEDNWPQCFPARSLVCGVQPASCIALTHHCLAVEPRSHRGDMPTVQVKRTGEENGGQAKRPRKEDVSPTPQPVAALPPAAAPPSSIVSPTPAAAEEAKAAATKAPIKKTGAPAGKKPVTPTQRKRKSGGGAADGIARGGAVESNEEWGRMYGVLKKFMTQHDNAFPGAKDTVARDDESGEHDTIGLWCISQRERRMGKRPGPLSDVQVEKLDALGEFTP